MLEKDMYDSWRSRMEMYMLNRQHDRIILESVEHGPLLWPSVTEEGVTRLKKYSKLSAAEAFQADCDKGETLRDFYLRFSLLLNEMNMYYMKLEQFQVNTKFLNTLPPEWSKFVTDVKLLNMPTYQHHHQSYQQPQFQQQASTYQSLPYTTSYHTPQFVSQGSSSSNLSISYPMNDTSLTVNHNAYMASAPQIDYAPIVHHLSECSLPETRLVVPVFQKGDDPIDAINHMMSFLTSVVTSKGRKDKDKDEDPSAGLDRGLKKRKTSKDAEPTQGLKAKESQSVSSKGNKSKSKSSRKSVHSEKPAFEVADSDMPHDQDENLDNDGKHKEKIVFKCDCFTKPTQPQEPTYIRILARLHNKDKIKSPVKVSYDKHALWGISHWMEQRKTFYAYARGLQSKHDAYSTKRILAVTQVENRLTNRSGDDVSDFAIALRMFIKAWLFKSESKIFNSESKVIRKRSTALKDIHLNFDTIKTLAKDNLITGIPKFKYTKDHLCLSCEQGKSKKQSHKPKPVPNSQNRLHLHHNDLCGPMRVESINGKRYILNDHEDIGKLGAKDDIGFFIDYSTTSCAYKVYNRRTKKVMETMNVTFDELLAMAFEQRISKPELQGRTSGHINLRLDITYAPLKITPHEPTEHDLELLFKSVYDDYMGG
nr:ribonuclease H-like domain-containing protein [Tanacetum cinerariifolium]